MRQILNFTATGIHYFIPTFCGRLIYFLFAFSTTLNSLLKCVKIEARKRTSFLFFVVRPFFFSSYPNSWSNKDDLL